MGSKELKVIDLGTSENKWNKLYFRTLGKGYTLEEIEKELKALEIIKEKPQIEITHIQWGKIKTYDEYLKRTHEWDLEYGDMVLTEEEFDLLKEVLK